MASDVSRIKAAKLVAQDFAVQAAVSNVLENNRLIAEAAREACSDPLAVCCVDFELHQIGVILPATNDLMGFAPNQNLGRKRARIVV
jgi:hypothetical protein